MIKTGGESESEPAMTDRANDARLYGGDRPSGQSQAVTESETLAREIKDGALSGYIGPGTTFKGEISFKGIMRVNGHVSGQLSSDNGTLLVGDGGQVDADLKVAVALIRGTVNGDVIASERIELGRTARVNGNIQTGSLSIDKGAFFEGDCRMSASAASPAAVKNEAAPLDLGSIQNDRAAVANLKPAVRNEATDQDATPAEINPTS